MAKKKNKGGKPNDPSASEEILDALAEDVGADDATDSETQDEAEKVEEPVVPKKAASKKKASAPVRAERKRAQSDNRVITDMLTGVGAHDNVDLSDIDVPGAKPGLNLLLIVALLATGGVGFWKFREVSSAETMNAKHQARIDAEATHMAEQLAKQKKWGTLRIESNPPQAAVFKNDAKMMAGGIDVTGAKVEREVLTPVNMNNLNIAEPLKFRVEKNGYETYEFSVAEHLWTKDAATGEYKFFKMVELAPSACEYWYLYDAKKKRELQFPEKAECAVHYDEATAGNVSVTECTCKQPPEGTDIEEFLKKQQEEREKRAKKAAKKGKKRR